MPVEQELVNPVYREEEELELTELIIYREKYSRKRGSIMKKLSNCLVNQSHNISFSNEKTNYLTTDEIHKSIQFMAINLILKVFLTKEDYLWDELSYDFDNNQLVYYFIQHHQGFMTTEILLGKINSIYLIYSKQKSKSFDFIFLHFFLIKKQKN